MVNTCLVCREEGLKGYFQMPKDEKTREEWVKATKIGDWFIQNTRPSHRICFRHFAPEDILYSPKRISPKSGMILAPYFNFEAYLDILVFSLLFLLVI